MQLIQVIVGGGNPKPADKSLIALAGVTKVFVGEVVEEARRVALELGAKGPLQPAHVHAAYQRLKERGIVEAAPPSRRKMKL